MIIGLMYLNLGVIEQQLRIMEYSPNSSKLNELEVISTTLENLKNTCKELKDKYSDFHLSIINDKETEKEISMQLEIPTIDIIQKEDN